MKVTVLVQAYPSEHDPAVMAFVHSRNLWYAAQGVDVDVVSFRARAAYAFEGISVRPFTDVRWEAADLVVSHAPNLRNHARVLWNVDKPIVFFFHGAESLRKRWYYPAPYPFQRSWRSRAERAAFAGYDVVKVRALGRFLERTRATGSRYVFVSAWMRDQFLLSVPRGAHAIAGRDAVIPNAVHESFAATRFVPPSAPAADFVTFRPNLDQPKYAIDAVVAFARAHPQFTFDVYGRGRLLELMGAPANVRHHDVIVRQAEMIERAGAYRAALLPSRFDTQGVTACEMAMLGMPTLVSDIPVARTMLGDFVNVALVDDAAPAGLAPAAARLWAQPVPPARDDFLPSTTCARELALFEDVLVQAPRG